MIYPLVKILVKFASRAYFRKVCLINIDKVPVNKPVLLLPNHPNSFLDAIVVCTYLPQPGNFLVRSDVFNTPFKRWLLRQLNNHPIYRIQEGTENVKKNEETFRLCGELFKEKRTILIFPEGLCVREKRMRKLKKGAARIALGSEEAENFSLDLQLVCVGVNYSKFGRMGGEVLVKYDEPIHVRDYKDQYRTEKAKAVNDLTQEIESRLSKLIVHVPSKDEDILFDRLYDMSTRNKSCIEKFNTSWQIASNLQKMKKEDAVKLETLKENSNVYNRALFNAGLKDNVIGSFKRRALVIDLLLLILSFPLFMAGIVFNYIPYKLSFALSTKVVKQEEFFDSVNMIAGSFVFILFHLFSTFLFGLLEPDRYLKILFFFSLPVLGVIAYWWYNLYKTTQGRLRLSKLSRSESDALKHQREVILKAVHD